MGTRRHVLAKSRLLAALGATAALCLLPVPTVPSAAALPPPAPGSLDPTFDGDGRAITPIGDAGQGTAMAVQADGRIVVAGFSEQPATGRDFVVVRYNPDGSLDETFSGDGVASVAVGPGFDRDEAYAVAVQPDGRIVIAGETWTGSITHAAVARLHADGTLDTSFGGDGAVVLAIGTRSTARGVAIQADGRIVIAGGATELSGGVGLWIATARLTVNGALDPSFTNDGYTITTLGNTSAAHAVALQPDGAIVVAGRMVAFSPTYMVLIRYRGDGSVDTSFGNGGNVQSSFGTSSSGVAPNDTATAVDLLPDGRIVVAGFSSLPSRFQMSVVRHRGNGSLDPTWGGDGIVTTEVGTVSQAFGVAVSDDGSALVAGESNSAGMVDIGLVRYQPDGSLDGAFGSGGIVRTDVGTARNGARAIEVQADGRILVAGHSVDGAENGVNVVRYHGDDRTPPDEPVLSSTNPASPANENSPFVLGSAEPGSTVRLYANQSCAGGPAATGTAEQFASVGIAVAVPDDSSTTWRATATDPAGNVSDCSASSISYIEDSTAPETTITQGPEGLTDSTTHEFAFVSDEPARRFECRVDDGPRATCESPHSVGPLENGVHTFEVAATDAAGNVDASPATRSFRVCSGPSSAVALRLDALLRPINPAAADAVVSALCDR